MNYGASSGSPDPVLGQDLDVDGLVKIAQVLRQRGAIVVVPREDFVTFDEGRVGELRDDTVASWTSPRCASTSSVAAM